jgi:hypothetical protein
MRNLINIIAETMSNPVEWHWTRRSQLSYEAKFSIDDVIYEVSIFNGDRGIYTISFGAYRRKDGPYSASQATLGTGNAFKVYSTVIEIVANFEEDLSDVIRGFIIESDVTERSRHRVNLMIAKKLQASFSQWFTIEDDADGGEIHMTNTEYGLGDEDEDDEDDLAA